MLLYKLFNKVRKQSYPDVYNEYATEFHFDRRLVHLYTIIPSDNTKVALDNTGQKATLDSGALIYVGNIKESFDAFKAFVDMCTFEYRIQPNDVANFSIKLYWEEILESGFCNGEAALYFLTSLKLIELFDKDTLLKLSLHSGNVQCSELLLKHFNVTNAEVYLNEFIHMDEAEFAAVVIPHLSSEYIANLNIDAVTAKHRYKTTRHLLYGRQLAETPAL